MAVQIYNTTATFSTTGIKTVSPGFTPVGYEIIVSAKGGENYDHFSHGFVDNSGYATCHSFVGAVGTTSTGGTVKTALMNGTVVSVLEPVSTSYGTVVLANHDSFTSTSIKFNVTQVLAAYQFNIRIWG